MTSEERVMAFDFFGRRGRNSIVTGTSAIRHHIAPPTDLETLEPRTLLAADLLVDALRLPDSVRGNIAEGHRVTVSVEVSNLGNSAAGLFEIDGRLSKDQVWGNADDVTIHTERTQSGVPAGAVRFAFLADVVVPELPRKGLHYIGIKIDSFDEIAESNEQNNVFWGKRLRVNKVRTAQIRGNNLPIPADDSSPRAEDRTYFGAVNVSNASVEHEFTLWNVGRGTLRPAAVSVSLEGPESADFVVTQQPLRSTLDWSGFASAFTTFRIAFDPTIAGTRSAQVVVRTDDPRRPEHRFTITGEGLLAASVRVGFADVSLPYPDGRPFEVHGSQTFLGIWNEGSAALEVGRIRLSDRFGGVLSIRGGRARTIEPGGFAQFFIVFSPTEPGVYDSVLSAPTNVVGAGTVLINIRAERF